MVGCIDLIHLYFTLLHYRLLLMFINGLRVGHVVSDFFVNIINKLSVPADINSVLLLPYMK